MPKLSGERPEGRSRTLAWLFAAALLAVEMAFVAVAGMLLGVDLGGAPAAPAAIALAYALLVVVSGVAARPPALSRLGAVLRVLAAVFLVAFCLAATRRDAAILRLVAWAVTAMIGVAACRRAAMALAVRLPALRPPPRPVAFLGNSPAALTMLDQILADSVARLSPVGYFDDRNDRAGPLTGRLPCLGTIDDLVRYIHENELRDVFMAMPWSAGERIVDLLHRLRFLPLTVRLIPETIPALGRANSWLVDGVVLPTLMAPPFSTGGQAAKRALDIAVSALLLAMLAPAFLLVALLVRLDSRGPVFFRQVRLGQYGRSFRIFKFRSLHVAQADASAETLVGRGDRRVTRLGRILRKYSLDEMPQLLNVLAGDMSLVGPRPHAARAKADGRIYAEVIPDYMLRYRVRPGMTGWAQVNGWRGNTDTVEKLRKRVEFDFAYIESWSLRRDLEILFRTIPSMLAPPADNA
jgi:Undecaprenyl-phosphate glucose phosphotransferase